MSLQKSEVSLKNTFNKPKCKSSSLLINFGFSEDFFTNISYSKSSSQLNNTFKKISSESTVESLSNNYKTQKDMEELYQEDEDTNYLPIEASDNFQITKETKEKNQLDNASLFKKMDNYSKNAERQVIKAYKSKHKSKYYELYEFNSMKNEELNKYRIFHKCNFPNCNRTFSSSGWLKAHFDEHFKEIKGHVFSILFDKYIKGK